MFRDRVRHVLGLPWAPLASAVVTGQSALLWSYYDDERWLLGAAAGLVLTALLSAVCPAHANAAYFPWRRYDAPVFAVAAVVAVALVGSAVEERREASFPLETANRLRQLALALANYESSHRHWPGPAIPAPDGTPLLSWRVALLPYLEHEELYQQFRLNEPWDSPHNFALLPHMPRVFAPVPGTEAEPFTTPFRVFVGLGTAFEDDRVRSGRMLDGAHNTVAVVEASETVPWTKPEGLAFGPDILPPPLGRVRSNRHRGLFPHPRAGHYGVAMCDGTVLRVPTAVSEASLRAAITRNGRDSAGPDWPR